MKHLILASLLALSTPALAKSHVQNLVGGLCPNMANIGVIVVDARKKGVKWEHLLEDIHAPTKGRLSPSTREVLLYVMTEAYFKYPVLDRSTAHHLSYLNCEQQFYIASVKGAL